MERGPHKDQQQPPLRALLPAPLGARKETVDRQKPARVNACEACRARKSKCDNGKPRCTACITRDTECRHGETESRQYRRRYQQLKDKRTAQEELFDLLQTMSERDAGDVFRRVRAGATAEAVVQHIQEGSLIMELSVAPEVSSRYEFPYIDRIPSALQESTYFRSHVYEAIEASEQIAHQPAARQSNYAKPLLSASLVEPLLDSIRTTTWTNISTNERLMRTLLEAYFVNQYPLQFFFHKDYFLEDMASRGTNFCSPLLVNALLAKACTSSRLLPNRTKFWDPDNLSYRFLAEAKRLWELDDGELKLTTIHAGCLINAAMNDFGHDEPGFAYTLKALNMAQRMGVFQLGRTNNTKLEKAKVFTAWGLFSWLTQHSYYYFKPPCLLDVPAHPLPAVESNPEWYGEVSLRYPHDPEPYAIGFGHVMKALSELRVIQQELCLMCFDRLSAPRKMPWGAALHIQAKLDTWYEALPVVLKPQSVVYPSQLDLHCEYRSVLITLFETQLSSTDGSSSSLTDGQHDAAQAIIAQAKMQLESIIRIYYLRHGFEAYDAMLIIFLAHLANITLAFLERFEHDPASVPADTIESLYSTLILCLKGLYDQARSFYLPSVMLAVMKKRLSADVRNLIGQIIISEDSDTDTEFVEEWITGQSRSIVSELVLPGVRFNEDPKAWRLANMAHVLGLQHSE